MKHRKLQIAWTVTWTVAVTVVILLWVRSYSILDYGQFHFVGRTTLHYQSVNGQAICFRLEMKRESQFGSFSVRNQLASLDYQQAVTGNALPGGGVQFNTWRSTWSLCLRYWIIAVMFIAIGALAWLPFRRYSLRTLLISTTIAAVGLALIHYCIY